MWAVDSLNASNRRYAIAFILGALTFYGSQMIAQLVVVSAIGGNPLRGLGSVIFALLFAPLFTLMLAMAYRLVPTHLSAIGLRLPSHLRSELLVGIAIGVLWPALEFFVLIPVTGGAARSDVIASRRLVGDSLLALLAALVLGVVVGGYGEELFFRGHIITILERLLPSKWGTLIGSILSTTLFALGHTYQGVTGIIDTGAFALLMVLLFLRRRSLLAPIVAHSLNDVLLLIGLYVWY